MVQFDVFLGGWLQDGYEADVSNKVTLVGWMTWFNDELCQNIALLSLILAINEGGMMI